MLDHQTTNRSTYHTLPQALNENAASVGKVNTGEEIVQLVMLHVMLVEKTDTLNWYVEVRNISEK